MTSGARLDTRRHYSGHGQAGSSAGESSLFCRSDDVYTAVDSAGRAMDMSSARDSPPVGSESRGAVSSLVGLWLSRGPHVGSW
jgi:hypothetical protein